MAARRDRLIYGIAKWWMITFLGVAFVALIVGATGELMFPGAFLHRFVPIAITATVWSLPGCALTYYRIVTR